MWPSLSWGMFPLCPLCLLVTGTHKNFYLKEPHWVPNMYLIEQLQFRDRIYYFSWTQSIIFHNKVTMHEQFNVSWDMYCSSIPRMSVWTYLRTYGALGTAVFLCSSKYAITYFPISFFPQSRVSFSHMCHCNLMNRPLWQTLLMLKKKKKKEKSCWKKGTSLSLTG